MALPVGRLKRRPDFLRVANARSKFVAPGLIVQSCPSDVPGECVRLGFTATRKIGGAVERNRARRRLKEAARLIVPELGQAGYDYVVVARQGTLHRDWPALLGDMRRALVALAPKDAR